MNICYTILYRLPLYAKFYLWVVWANIQFATAHSKFFSVVYWSIRNGHRPHRWTDFDDLSSPTYDVLRGFVNTTLT